MSTRDKKLTASTDNNEAGVSLVEYALLVALIAVVIIAAMTNFQLAVSKQYSGIIEVL
jgi:Flp pilus assembly pilin Flp